LVDQSLNPFVETPFFSRQVEAPSALQVAIPVDVETGGQQKKTLVAIGDEQLTQLYGDYI